MLVAEVRNCWRTTTPAGCKSFMESWLPWVGGVFWRLEGPDGIVLSSLANVCGLYVVNKNHFLMHRLLLCRHTVVLLGSVFCFLCEMGAVLLITKPLLGIGSFFFVQNVEYLRYSLTLTQ